jgi:hypothetical protein
VEGGIPTFFAVPVSPEILPREVQPASNLRPNSGDQSPVHTKSCLMPTDDSFRCDDRGELVSILTRSAERLPIRAYRKPETRARMSALQRDELLTQSEILEKETSPPAQEAYQHSGADHDEAKHGQDL